jgi:DNA-binding NarL/FixJ family response regulator
MADLHLVAAPPTGGVFSPSSPIRVVLAEDHAVLRTSLRLLLDAEDGIEVIAAAEDLHTARRHVRGESPHVLVLDLGMIRGAVRETIGKLRTRAPGTQVVLLTMDDSAVVAKHILACGALGFVLKDQADGELAPAVRAVADGQEYVSPRITMRLDSTPLPHRGVMRPLRFV